MKIVKVIPVDDFEMYSCCDLYFEDGSTLRVQISVDQIDAWKARVLKELPNEEKE